MTAILDFRSRFGSAHLKAPNLQDFVLAELGKAKANSLVHPYVTLGDPGQPLKDAPIAAQVNACDLGGQFGWQGRWIVACDSCGGAEYVDRADPVFMCCSCFNVAHGHQWRAVTLPAKRTQARIEQLLEKRPTHLRNWLPDEGVDDLEEQNRVLKVGV